MKVPFRESRIWNEEMQFCSISGNSCINTFKVVQHTLKALIYRKITFLKTILYVWLPN